MMDLTTENVKAACQDHAGEFAYALLSFLTDIQRLAESVQYVNEDVCDYWISIPTFNVHCCHESVVVNLSLKYCGKTFKRYFRYKCGHAYERIFHLAYFTMYPDCVYFYSRNLLWN